MQKHLTQKNCGIIFKAIFDAIRELMPPADPDKNIPSALRRAKDVMNARRSYLA